MKINWPGFGPRDYRPKEVRNMFDPFMKKFGEKKEEYSKEHGKLLTDETGYYKSRKRLPILQAKHRLISIAREAMLAQNRTGKYAVLTADQVLCTAGAIFSRHDWLVAKVKSVSDLLDIAYGTYYAAGNNISRKLELFEKLKSARVVLNGHGCYHPSEPWVKVPHGKIIHFYCAHGRKLFERDSMPMESYFGGGILTMPMESAEGGKSIPNYFLGFPRNLNINVRRTTGIPGHSTVAERLGGIPDNFVINMDSNRCVPLSVLFKDSRVQRAKEIHWSACREKAPKGAQLKHGYLYLSSEGKAKLYGGYGKVTTLRSRKEVK